MAELYEFQPREPVEGKRKVFLPVEARDDDERAELSLLRAQLLEAIGGKNQDVIAAAKRSYEARFPDEREAIETLFGVVDFLNTQRAVEEMKARDGRAPRELWRGLTEYHCTLTHFVKTNGEHRVFLDSFWRLLQDAGKQWGARGADLVGKLRAGGVTEVGISRAFEELHEDTQLSHPDDDAFKSTDLWVEGHPVQVKGVKGDVPELIEVDAITYPATRVRRGKEDRYYTSHFDEAIDQFSFKIGRYGSDRLHRDTKGYFVVVPYRWVDSVTGAPTEELVHFLGTHTGSRQEYGRVA